MKTHRLKAYVEDENGKVEDERYAHKILAKTITTMVHGEEALKAIEATNAFFDPELAHIKTWSKERIEDHFSAVQEVNI